MAFGPGKRCLHLCRCGPFQGLNRQMLCCAQLQETEEDKRQANPGQYFVKRGPERPWYLSSTLYHRDFWHLSQLKRLGAHVTKAHLLRFLLLSFPFPFSFLHRLPLPFLSLLFPSSFPASLLSSFPLNLSTSPFPSEIVLLCNSSCSQTCSNPPASASQVLGL